MNTPGLVLLETVARPLAQSASKREHHQQSFRAGKTRWLWWLAGSLGLIGLLSVWHADFCLSLTVGFSMQPTLYNGDLLLVSKHAYHHSWPQRGDIVVARSRADLIVKRIVGLPGEEVSVQRGRVYINQQRLTENHAIQPGLLMLGAGRLGSGKYALLGDNRDMMPAESVHAIVPKERLIGKVVFVWHWGRS